MRMAGFITVRTLSAQKKVIKARPLTSRDSELARGDVTGRQTVDPGDDQTREVRDKPELIICTLHYRFENGDVMRFFLESPMLREFLPAEL